MKILLPWRGWLTVSVGRSTVGTFGGNRTQFWRSQTEKGFVKRILGGLQNGAQNRTKA